MHKLKKLFSSGKEEIQIPEGPPARKVLMTTSLGEITFELFPESAPKAVSNFALLSAHHRYESVIFHRVIPGFMIQSGDPTGTGFGGKSIYGRKFEDEIDPNLSHDRPGVLSMANSGPKTNGSQFFVTLGECRHLDGKHTIFGRAVGGMEIVERIGKVRIGELDRPVEDVKIVEARAYTEEGGVYGS